MEDAKEMEEATLRKLSEKPAFRGKGLLYHIWIRSLKTPRLRTSLREVHLIEKSLFSFPSCMQRRRKLTSYAIQNTKSLSPCNFTELFVRAKIAFQIRLYRHFLLRNGVQIKFQIQMLGVLDFFPPLFFHLHASLAGPVSLEGFTPFLILNYAWCYQSDWGTVIAGLGILQKTATIVIISYLTS